MDRTVDKVSEAFAEKLWQGILGGDNKVKPPEDQVVVWLNPGIPFQESDLDFASTGALGGEYEPPQTQRDEIESALMARVKAGQLGAEKVEAEFAAEIEKRKANHAKRLPRKAAEFALAVDTIPSAAGLVDGAVGGSYTGKKISAVYGEALRNSEVGAAPLTEEQKAKLLEYQGHLDPVLVDDPIFKKKKPQPSPLVTAYETAQAAFEAEVLAYNAKRIAYANAETRQAVQEWTTNGSIYYSRVDRASKSWIATGYKNEYETMVAYKNSVMRRDLNLFKEELLERMKKSELTAGAQQFLETSFVPSDFARRSEGWTHFRFSSDLTSKYESHTNHKWDAQVKVPVLSWFTDLHNRGNTHEDIDTHENRRLTISFDMTQVIISRPWFSPEFLESRAWRYKIPSGDISDGGRPPKGIMPMYATMALFAKNLVIDFDGLQDEKSKFRKDLHSGVGVNFGPFSIGGTHETDSDETKSTFKVTKDGLSVSGLQLFALRCHILAKSPNPDNAIQEWK